MAEQVSQSKTVIDVKEAIHKARAFLNEIYEGEHLPGFLLEAI